MSDPQLTDIGDILAVPEHERLDHDDHVEEEVNVDAGDNDFTHVDDGDDVDIRDLDDEDANGPIGGAR
ncbi:hypothetical protein [Nocardioides marmoraquaticus]